MIDDPTTQGGRSNPQPDRSTSSSSQSATPAGNTKLGDPIRRDFGDRTDDAPTSTKPAQPNAKPASVGGDDKDAGEGHKGPRPDFTTGPAGTKAERPNAPAQPQASGQSNPGGQSKPQNIPPTTNTPPTTQPQPKAPQPSNPTAPVTKGDKPVETKPARPQSSGTSTN